MSIAIVGNSCVDFEPNVAFVRHSSIEDCGLYAVECDRKAEERSSSPRRGRVAQISLTSQPQLGAEMTCETEPFILSLAKLGTWSRNEEAQAFIEEPRLL
jgi:hypothetical protein